MAREIDELLDRVGLTPALETIDIGEMRAS
jgi:hypothetical protein